MKSAIKLFSVLFLVGGAAFLSCEKKPTSSSSSNNTNNQGGTTTTTQYFGIKTATITYNFIGVETVYFDDYGRKFKVSYDYQSELVDNESWIIDDAANKAYHLDDSLKTYQEIPIDAAKGYRSSFVWTLTEAQLTAAGYTISHQTIAGKDCSSYTVTSGSTTSTTTTAFWNKILFLSATNSGDVLRVTSITESVPAGIFSVPSNYTKVQ